MWKLSHKNVSLYFFNKHCSVYSRTSPNDHLSATATYFVPVDGPYIDSRLNLVTTATSLQRQRPRH